MRKNYLDNVRWMTVVIVVIYHVIYMFNGVTTFSVVGPFNDSQPQDVFQYLVYPWFMVLLFVISGISSRYYLNNHTEKEFLRNRTRKLLVPSTIGLFVFGWILGYYNVLLGGGMESMSAIPKPIMYLIFSVSGSGPLWYIQMLWVFSVVLILIRKLEKDRLFNRCEKAGLVILLVLTLLIYGSAQILNTPVISVYRFGIYSVAFLIGYFVLSHNSVMERVEKNWILLTSLAIISCIVFTVMYFGKPFADHEVVDTLVCNIFAWLGTLGVLAFMKKWGDFENSFSKWMNAHSWGLYVFHYLPVLVSAYYLRKDFPDMAPLLVYLLVMFAGFAGAYLLNAVISRIPVLRWCILGIKKEKK